MLSVSLHGIKIVAPIGMYADEKIHPNSFEIDVDVWVHTEEGKEWSFIDYAIINDIVSAVFTPDKEMLEQLVQEVHKKVKKQFADAEKVKVCVRKLHPPLSNSVNYSQVCLEG